MARQCVLCEREAPPGVISCPSCGSEWFTPHSGTLNLRMRLARRYFSRVERLMQKMQARYVRYFEENGLPFPPGMEDPFSLRRPPTVREPEPAPVPLACPACSGTCGEEESTRCRVRRLAAMRTEEDPREDLETLEENYEESAELVELMCFAAPHDEAVYSWKVEVERENRFIPAVKMAAQHVLGPMVIFYAGLSAIELLFPRVAFWIAVFLVFTCVSVFHPLARWTLRVSPRLDVRQNAQPGYPMERHAPVMDWWGKRLEDVGMTFMGIFLVSGVAFLVGSPHYWFHGGFTGDTGGRLAWALYGAQLFLNTVTLDALEVLGVNAAITPVSFAARASVVLVKVLTGFCVAGIIYDLVRHSREPFTMVGTGDEMWGKVFGLRVASITKIAKTGRVAPYDPPYVLEWNDSAAGERLRRGYE